MPNTNTESRKRNPPWSRDELTLALDLYLRFRDSLPAKGSAEIADLSALLSQMGRPQVGGDAGTYRNVNGVYMKLMNFRRLDPAYTAVGKVGLRRGNKDEAVVWDDHASDPSALRAAISAIHARIQDLVGEETSDDAGTAGRMARTAEQLAALEGKYIKASPEVRERLSRGVERGPIGTLVKRLTSFRCQLCEALGRDPLGFLKPNGEPYVEAHHVMPVAGREVGSLSASNVITLCANHHRQMHYGGIRVAIAAKAFELVVEGKPLRIPRLGFTDPLALPGGADG